MAIQSLIKTDKMNEYRKIDLYRAIKDNGSVNITVVPHNEENNLTREIEYTNYDEALADITGLEYENEIYF
tara:strand:- start:286 stop:498 length:213 start_codon:yes stop_codon:yes gene_type:complete